MALPGIFNARIVRLSLADSGDADDWGIVPTAETASTVIPARLWQRTAREAAVMSGAGPVVSDWSCVVPRLTAITEQDRFRLDPDDGRRWTVDNVRDPGGQNAMLELGCRLVEADSGAA